MNCEDFEMLMADALGEELSPDDRPTFEDHLSECERCRREYESARATVTTLRNLPGARGVSVHREGSRLVIEDPSWASRGAPAAARQGSPAHRLAGNVFRYAAGLLIAFIGGYGLHAAITAADAARRGREVALIAGNEQPDEGKSLQSVFASDYARNSGRSDLAKCLLAMSHTRH